MLGRGGACANPTPHQRSGRHGRPIRYPGDSLFAISAGRSELAAVCVFPPLETCI